jgi:hypothetical protein
MYVVVRRYGGAPRRGETVERARRVREGFVPLLRRQTGFRAYYMFGSEDASATSVIAFDRPEDAEAAHHDIRRWAIANLHDLTPGPPDLVSGEVLHDDLVPLRQGRDPYVTVTVFDGVPPVEPAVPQEPGGLVRRLAQQPGLQGMYILRGEVAPTRWIGVGVFDGPDAAAVAHETVREFIRSTPKVPVPQLERHIGGQALVAEVVHRRDGGRQP